MPSGEVGFGAAHGIARQARVISGEHRAIERGREVGMSVYRGKCFCGAVEIAVEGEPVGAGYCHCAYCRSGSAAPVNAFTLWNPAAVKVTRGEENVAVFHKTERSYRKWCRMCGGHLFTEHPQMKLIDVYAATIPTFPFEAGVHVNYAESVLRMKDGLPKLKDFPSELGGTGEVVPE